MPEQNAETVVAYRREIDSLARTLEALNMETEQYAALLQEARDLLWHDTHRPKFAGGKPCPGCGLESRIDTALGSHFDGSAAHDG
jgi:DNA repair exonuclease SbcCD ATPase subunit